MNKELIINTALILVCLLMLLLFPFNMAASLMQLLLLYVVFFVLVPIVYTKKILKQPLTNLGFQLGDWRQGIKWVGIAWAIAALCVVILVRYTAYVQGNDILQQISKSFLTFLVYELGIVGVFVVCFEIFFRGFVIATYRERLGRMSVLLQLGLFLLFLWLGQQLTLSFAVFPILAFCSGIVVYQTRSVVFAILSSWLFIILMDAILIRLFIR
ncbi:hypothetical protein EPO05_03575 [Patescibacteria group bacterium]|nr:MAG: hypothetical protein EPO05_03575 [Patescibacteria group bacterium]